MRGRWSKIIACVALALALSACFASLASAEGEEDTGGFGAFRLKGTNGFSILVMAYSKPRFKHGEVALLVIGKGEAAIYLAPATVTDTTIAADLGPVGEIAVRFESSGPRERVRARCEGGGVATFEPGAWVGTIDFTGEEGFTRVTTSRAKAIVPPFLDLGCGFRGIGETMSSREPGARLVARSSSKRNALFVQATRTTKPPASTSKPRSKSGAQGWSSPAKSAATSLPRRLSLALRCEPPPSLRPRPSPGTRFSAGAPSL